MIDLKRTTLTRTLEEAQLARVFTGGASNIINEKGHNVRNTMRDPLHQALTKAGLLWYDPQVHPDTHGETYSYEKHGPIEQMARKVALPFYEMSPLTFGAVTAFEIAMDHLSNQKPMVVWFSNGQPRSNSWPAHDPRGNPVFIPLGLQDNAVKEVHLGQMVRNANSARRYFIEFARQVDLPVSFEETGSAPRGAIRISQSEMHVVDMLEALCAHLRGEKAAVHFYGEETQKPLMSVDPTTLTNGKHRKYLNHYMEEGDALRRAICRLLSVNVLTRVVFSKEAAIKATFEQLALEDQE